MTDTEEIKNRIDVVDLVGSYIKLQKAGSNFKACCPFHREKTPSFNVSPARQIWHCFGCSKGGDIFEFIKEIEGIEFPEALKILAERAGVVLKAEDPVLRGERGREFLLLEEATKFFEKNLAGEYAGLEKSGDETNNPFYYLKARGLTDETIKEFRLGYAPAEWKSLFNHLLAKNFTAPEIERAGLIVKSQNSKFANQNYYDRFRGRIIYPIADYNGRIIAFGGRIFEVPTKVGTPTEVGAKYVNSPETNMYQKSKTLYGLNKSKSEILKEGECVVVEGYMDWLMSWQAGIKNVVASSGTALTENQLKILRRLSEKLIAAFDMDKAGEAAAARGIDLALAEGFEVRVVGELKHSQKSIKDPADAVALDPAIWQGAVQNSRHIVQFYIDSSLKKFTADSSESKREFQKSVIPVIASLPDLEKAHWVRVVSNVLNINEDAVWEALKKISRSSASKSTKDAVPEAIEPKTRKALLETKILSIISQYPMLADKIEAVFMPLLSKETASAAVFAELFLSGAVDAEAELINCQRELKKEFLKEKRMNLFKEIQTLEKTGGNVDKLMTDFQNINNELSKLI